MGENKLHNNNANVILMFQPNVLKYLNYIIQVLACSCETSMSRSNFDTFLQTVLEPRKQMRLDFRSAKQTLVSISINFSFQISTETTVNKTCCILFPCYRKLKMPKV